MRDVAMPSDPSKPLPEDVLRSLSLGLEFENKLIELCGETENTLALNPFEKNVKLLQSPQGSICEKEDGPIPTEGRDTSIKPLSIDEMRPSTIIETLDPKVIHHELACLSSWMLGPFTLKHNFSFDHVTLWGPCQFYGIRHGSCNIVLIAFWFFLNVSLNPPPPAPSLLSLLD